MKPVRIIQERLNTYKTQSWQEEELAIKEIFQEIVLAGLSSGDFFKHAAFQGGTALRILHSLDRFSEDLDFILKAPTPNFDLGHFIKPLKDEFLSYGIDVEIKDRSGLNAIVRKAFIKEESLGGMIVLNHYPKDRKPKKILVKIEVDTNPPNSGHFETKYLDFPFPFAVTVQDLPTLFSGKCHALLCREYVKGRDWYDFLWYVQKKSSINFAFLESACRQVGPWKTSQTPLDSEWFFNAMILKIKSIDWEVAKKDVRRFLTPSRYKTIDIWCTDFFLDRLQKLKG